MKKQLTALAAFRHQNPVARFVSIVVAFAIATLLVVGTGAAYADDAPDPAAPVDTSTAVPADDSAATEASADTPSDGSSDTPSDTGSADTSTTSTDAPSDAPSDTSADAGSADAPAPTAGPFAPMLKTLTIAAPNAADPCEDADANFLIGGFEIDGDECVGNHADAGLNGEDWAGVDTHSPHYGTELDHFVDDGDTTGFQGSSKALNNPLSWSKGPTPNDKSDIERVRIYSQKSGNAVPQHTFSDFAIDRHPDTGGAGGVGTVTYDVEYNRLGDVLSTDKSLLVPQRSPGDLWFVFDQSGNISLDYIAGWKFSESNHAGCKAVEGGGYWCPLNDVDFQGDTSDDGAFAEGTLDISQAFNQGVCFTFGVVNVRTRTSNTDTTAFKDYIAPINAITSNCGSLVITKTDSDTGEAVGGAVFQVTGDPRPNGAGVGDADYQLCVYDGLDSALGDLTDANPQLLDPDVCDELIADDSPPDGTVSFDPVVAGNYDVTEIVPPPGYMLNGDETDHWNGDVVDGEPSEAPFSNRRIWQPLSITKDAAGTFGATYHWKINKEISPTGEEGSWVDGTKVGDPLVKTVESGDDTHLYYKLVVTEDGVDASDYVVTGRIHVGNDNPVTFPDAGAVDASLGEELDGCKLDSTSEGFPVDVTVPSGGTDFAYTCLLNGPIDEPATNTASVTWDMNDYPQATTDLTPDTNADHYSDSADSDPFSFVETDPVNKTVTITDDTGDLAAGWSLTYGVGGPSHESDVYKYDPAPGAGSCSEVITNTATVFGDDGKTPATQGDGKDAVDSENGEVCVEAGLSVDVSSDESLTRTFPWDIEKSTTTPKVTVLNGQATAHYKVVVTALGLEDSDSGWTMTGSATISNPNDFIAKQVSGLDIAYSGGGTCTPTDALPLVAADDSAVVHFSCDFGTPATQPDYDGEVTATVAWDADAESADDPTPWAVTEGDWLDDATLVNEFVKVFDDHAAPGTEDPLFGGIQLQWQNVYDSTVPADHQMAVEYDHTYTSGFPAAGSCKNVVNTAWVRADAPSTELASAAVAPEGALANDDATVSVCTPAIIVLPPRPQVSPPAVLPNTGGPDASLLGAGLILLLGGATLLAGGRRHRRRS
jgi:hypothetical protein